MSHSHIFPTANIANASPSVSVANSNPQHTAEPRKRTPSSSVIRRAADLPAGESDAADSQPWGRLEQSDCDSDQSDMENVRPPLHRPTDGRSGQPLLYKPDDERGRTGYNQPSGTEPRSPVFSRRSTMRSRSPDTQARLATRKKYTYAAFFLVVSLIGFTVQTETAVYIQHVLGWNKAYCMLYLTHGSWSLLWPTQLLVLRFQKWHMPWRTFWRRHVFLIRTTAQMVETKELVVSRDQHSPILYFIKMTAFITCSLTVAGGSWYVAVNLTSASDLTAIYNCSAFFAYVFSVLLLDEKLRLDKSFSVLVAIIGVFVVAYGDSKDDGDPGLPLGTSPERVNGSNNRLLGNVIIGIGSIVYGFYEVLYKKFACPPDGTSPGRGMIFANTFGSLMGCFTLLVLWIPFPVLHWTGLEPFELPSGEAAWVMLISTLASAVFSGSFLALISLTSPVLSSVAALLSIFIVAIVDWILTGKPLKQAAIVGGLLIIGAFVLLSWSTFREMQEERRKSEVDLMESDESERED